MLIASNNYRGRWVRGVASPKETTENTEARVRKADIELRAYLESLALGHPTPPNI